MHLTAFVWSLFHQTLHANLSYFEVPCTNHTYASWTLHTLKILRMSTHNSDFSQTNELNVKAQTNARMKKIWKMRYSLVYVVQEKIVSESFCWLLFTLCELKECRRLCSKTLFMRTTKPRLHFLGEMFGLKASNIIVKALLIDELNKKYCSPHIIWFLYNISAWHGIVRKFSPLLTASLLLLLPNWGVEVRFHGNRNRGGQFGDTRTKTGHLKVDNAMMCVVWIETSKLSYSQRDKEG